MNLNQGAVSKALLNAAGPGLQSAVRSEARTHVLQYCNVIITKGFKLSCQKVFHAVCPGWDNGQGRSEEVRGFIQRLKNTKNLLMWRGSVNAFWDPDLLNSCAQTFASKSFVFVRIVTDNKSRESQKWHLSYTIIYSITALLCKKNFCRSKIWTILHTFGDFNKLHHILYIYFCLVKW